MIARRVRPWLAALLLASLPGCAATPSPPPAALGLDAHYSKYLDAGGIPITSSARVPDEALERARSIVNGLLRHRPDIRRELVAQNYRVAIIAEEEALLDLPEFADWTKPAEDDPRLTRCEKLHYEERIGRLSDRDYWNARARGMGGEVTIGAAEDLLGLPASRYYGETIFVHEFAHNILLAAKMADPQFYADVEAAYIAAQEQGLWHQEYMMTTIDEYWAEGTQLWFDSNHLKVMDGRRILNHQDLAAYDPQLYALLGRAYGDAHRLAGDPFHLHEARVPPGPIPDNTAEQC